MNTRGCLIAIAVAELSVAGIAQGQTMLARQVVASVAVRTSDGRQTAAGTAGQSIIGLASGGVSFGHFGFWWQEVANLPGGITTLEDPRLQALRLRALPNPAQGSFSIFVSLDASGFTTIALVDALGCTRCTLLQRFLDAGATTAWFEVGDVPSGDYRLLLTQSALQFSVPVRIVH